MIEQAAGLIQKPAVGQLFTNQVASFTTNKFNIEVLSGPIYSPIQLTVHEFVPQDTELLVFKKLVISNMNDHSIFQKSYSSPVGVNLRDISIADLSIKLESHIEGIATMKRNYGEVKAGNTSQLTWDVYEAIRLYQLDNPQVSLAFRILCTG